MIKVTNKRAGDIQVLAHGAFTLPSGVSYHDVSRFSSLGPGTQASLEDMVREGTLEIGEGSPEAPLAQVEDPKPSKPPPPNPDDLSDDDKAALEQIKNETNHARLDAWFTSTSGGRAKISEALLARITELS